MLLVHHDQAGARQRGEDRRARADQHLRLAARHRQPGAGALAVGQARVQRQHRHAEAGAEALQDLRGEPDLRHQHQRLPPRRQAVEDGAQVDLGLAAAGDALQQHRPEALAGAQGCQGLGLRRGGFGRRRPERQQALGRQYPAFGLALALQGAGGRAPALEVLQQVLGHRAPGQSFQQPPGAALAAPGCCQGRAPQRGQFPPVDGGFRQRLAIAQGDRQGGGQGFAGRGMVVADAEAQHAQQFLREQGLRVQSLGDFLQGVRGGLGRAGLEHDAHPTAPAEGHPNAAADPSRVGRRPGRRPVVEQSRQGHRQGDAQDRFGGDWHGQSLAEPAPAAPVDSLAAQC